MRTKSALNSLLDLRDHPRSELVLNHSRKRQYSKPKTEQQLARHTDGLEYWVLGMLEGVMEGIGDWLD